MALNRKVGFFTGLKYKGGGPMWAWILHRLSGLAMVFFVGSHILAGFLTQQFGSDVGIAINTVYENWIFQLVLFFLVIFHAINGLRVTILDLWPKLIEHFRTVINVEWIVFALIAGFAVIVVLQNSMGG